MMMELLVGTIVVNTLKNNIKTKFWASSFFIPVSIVNQILPDVSKTKTTELLYDGDKDGEYKFM